MTDRDHDDEGFLARWSRRKLAEQTAEPDPAKAPPAETATTDEDNDDGFDLAALPPLESLGRDSDYSAFLHAKVPDALRRAALRKAWTSDPKITGFKTFAEYDWDFNAPGYGALRATDDAAAFVKALFRHLDPVPPDDPTATEAEAGPEPGPERPPEAAPDDPPTRA